MWKHGIGLNMNRSEWVNLTTGTEPRHFIPHLAIALRCLWNELPTALSYLSHSAAVTVYSSLVVSLVVPVGNTLKSKQTKRNWNFNVGVIRAALWDCSPGAFKELGTSVGFHSVQSRLCSVLKLLASCYKMWASLLANIKEEETKQ